MIFSAAGQTSNRNQWKAALHMIRAVRRSLSSSPTTSLRMGSTTSKKEKQVKWHTQPSDFSTKIHQKTNMEPEKSDLWKEKWSSKIFICGVPAVVRFFGAWCVIWLPETAETPKPCLKESGVRPILHIWVVEARLSCRKSFWKLLGWSSGVEQGHRFAF